MTFICPLENSIFNIFDLEGLKLLTRLCLGFSHVNEHRFGHSFQECLNLLYKCSLETQNTSNYLLHCHHDTPFRTDLMNSVKTFFVEFESLAGCKKVETPLPPCDDNKNNSILSASINYIKKTKCCDCSLFDKNQFFPPILNFFFNLTFQLLFFFLIWYIVCLIL